MEKRIIIIGAGPCGLGAAYRLRELGYNNWRIYERDNHVGGLASSFKDTKGFTWDIGGHVLFSKYDRFNRIFEKLMKKQYLVHQRKAFIRAFVRWIPYPFQNNIRYLPKKYLSECILGLKQAQAQINKDSKNLKEWILVTFGRGIAKYFMLPHNLKVWSYPLDLISKDWISERISVVDIERIMANIINARDDVSWGPNNIFKFPLNGGTQDIFKRIEPDIKDFLSLHSELIEINLKKKELKFKSGFTEKFDYLINTSPINKLMDIITSKKESLLKKSKMLQHNSIFVVGIGIKGRCPEDKCWVYFPEKNIPFFRMTYFSNYSPNNVPQGRQCWSIMSEVTYTDYEPTNKKTIVDNVLQGLLKSSILTKKDLDNIISSFVIHKDFAYPIPTSDRDNILDYLQKFLEDNNVLSRGRFGGWRYEIGNMDHSFMQGIEVVDRILNGKPETVWKVNYK